MAEYTRQEIKIQKFELKLPSNAVEVDKMLGAAYQRFESIHGKKPSDEQVEICVEPGDFGEFYLVASFKENN